MNGASVYIPRGRALGGSSSINGMVYIRGHRSDYDDWKAAGNTGWGWDDVLPYFIKAEGKRGVPRFGSARQRRAPSTSPALEQAEQLFQTQHDAAPDQLDRLSFELSRVRREAGNLLRAIETGQAPRLLLERLREKEAEAGRLEFEIQNLRTARDVSEIDVHRVWRVLEDHLGRFGDRLRGDLVAARQALSKLQLEPYNARRPRTVARADVGKRLVDRSSGGPGRQSRPCKIKCPRLHVASRHVV
jgi:choline dehydrogenase-like flavoprotein